MYAGNWTITGTPTAMPITLLDLKTHLRLESNYDHENLLLADCIASATDWIQERQGRQLMTATAALVLDSFPACDSIKLPRPPLQSVSSITYVDNDGATQTLATSVYTADTYSEPGRVRLKYNQSWPATRFQPNAVTITYVCGYSSASSVPASTRQAVTLLADHHYINRDQVVVGGGPAVNVPLTVERLADMHAVCEVP